MSGYRCPGAPSDATLCPPEICDCFIDMYPEDPLGLHPEAFTVAINGTET